jgi:hypothetical protein
MATAQQPAYRAFTVVKREGQDDFWLAIGAAFPHQSGDGFNVVLQALPIPNGVATGLAFTYISAAEAVPVTPINVDSAMSNRFMSAPPFPETTSWAPPSP